MHKRFGLQKQKKIKPVRKKTIWLISWSWLFLQQSREDSILLAEFNSRKKRVKQTCEKHGAFTSKYVRRTTVHWVQCGFLKKSFIVVLNNKKIWFMTTINYFFIREKLKAKLKLDPGPEMSPTVETDDQLWGHLKKWDLYWVTSSLSLTTNWPFQNEPSSVLRPEGARVDVVQGPEGGLHVPAVRLPPAGSRPLSPDTRGQSRGITRPVHRSIFLQRRGVVKSNHHLPQSASLNFSFTNKNEMQTTTFGLS